MSNPPHEGSITELGCRVERHVDVSLGTSEAPMKCSHLRFFDRSTSVGAAGILVRKAEQLLAIERALGMRAPRARTAHGGPVEEKGGPAMCEGEEGKSGDRWTSHQKWSFTLGALGLIITTVACAAQFFPPQ
ncbi:hypothetical protein ACFY78_36755 [Streptomyces olindensis]|uniref:hypothetical protein n=1 Tax=Streptomyces olindensis TaxID=358823 RepID=UPI00369152F1